MPWRENKGVCQFIRMSFWGLPVGKKYCGFTDYLPTKSLTKISTENALEFLALERIFMGIAS